MATDAPVIAWESSTRRTQVLAEVSEGFVKTGSYPREACVYAQRVPGWEDRDPPTGPPSDRRRLARLSLGLSRSLFLLLPFRRTRQPRPSRHQERGDRSTMADSELLGMACATRFRVVTVPTAVVPAGDGTARDVIRPRPPFSVPRHRRLLTPHRTIPDGQPGCLSQNSRCRWRSRTSPLLRRVCRRVRCAEFSLRIQTIILLPFFFFST